MAHSDTAVLQERRIVRQGAQDAWREARLDTLRGVLGLPISPSTRQTLQDAGIRAEYLDALQTWGLFRVPLVLDRLEWVAIHSKQHGASVKACELLLRLHYPTYQRLLGTQTADPAKSEVGELLRKILRQSSTESRVKLVREVMEVSTTSTPDAQAEPIVAQDNQPQIVEAEPLEYEKQDRG